ncbi:hypothetical protein EIN_403100 [Entamoeba invadens IP1]|uniref:Uncharacterized protein n=1 Tax=Entamoeba invadens IP1 TaxID=370355 RepID=A0A0A1UA19_ENTIV|nr:hypothetical protein EIN_403100 [Entamoeba invadens IP1]ELP89996.1 hypothetical protein EIN_403100 [Entamoeba invadens IP1]|eukprot:XP_004256767.1 hypothetical protein EIN_403100 [Entamoeba invadens IP1]
METTPLNSKHPHNMIVEPNSLRHNYHRFLRLKYLKCWRQISLVGGFTLMLIGGSIFSWSSYNRDIREAMGYSVSELNIIFSVGLFGVYFSFLTGFLFDHYGTRGALIYAFVMGTLGYLLYGLQVYLKYNTSAYLTCFFFFIATQGCSGLFQSAVQTSSHNFHRNIRGAVIGFMTSGFPLSGSIYSVIFTSCFKDINDGVAMYLFFLCVTTCVGSFLGMIIMFVVPVEDVFNSSYGKVKFGKIEGLTDHFVLSTDSQNASLSSSIENTPRDRGSFEYRNENQAILPSNVLQQTDEIQHNENLTEKVIVFDNYDQSDDLDNAHEVVIKTVNPIEQITSEKDGLTQQNTQVHTEFHESKKRKTTWLSRCGVLKVFTRFDFYLVIFSVALAAGPSLSLLSNVSLVLQANKVSEDRIELLAVLTSIFHAAGRFIFGCSSDLLVKIHINKALLLSSIAFVLTTLFCVLVLFQENASEIIIWIEPWFLGGILGVGPSLVSEMFGISNFGFNLGAMLTVVAISNIIVSTLSGLFYDSNITDGESSCYGDKCFYNTFFMSTFMCALSSILFMFLAIHAYCSKNKK